MLERHLRITNPLGLHARAAAQLVRQAARFRSQIMLIRDDTGVSANAKSILSVLHVAAAYGVSLRLTVDGIDEGEAMNAIERLFVEGFGEI
ncbi:MAG TPA: HPr family phosphocarrier protein [Pyrinomonadaceae bacterium]|nr:HPr family phosphocarrier protein [Pyrinomonadaceae bacterium]